MTLFGEARQEAYERALSAEPALESVVKVVDALLLLDEDKSENLDHWGIIKPLIVPWVGFGRGYVPSEASDVVNTPSKPKVRSFTDFLDEPGPARVPATTKTEKWMRTSEAYDAFTDVLLARLGY